jgi:alkane 1-monooxygenase
MHHALVAPDVRRRIRWRALRYTTAFIGPLLGFWGLTSTGPACWAFPVVAFVLIPLVEWLRAPDPTCLSQEEEQAALADPLFDALLVAVVPVQWGLLLLFLSTIGDAPLSAWDLAGRIATMGLLCGVYGINVAHELGHRARRWERDLSRALLLTSLYMHFIIEHNRGHHRHVATPEDPASARFGESLYAFWPRTIVFSFISAWRIEAERMKKEGRSTFSVQNEMIRSLVIELGFLGFIGLYWGTFTLLCFLAAALIGILLLETVNYIEHYGMGRPLNDRGSYGRVHHIHSWNSDHRLGRLMLFELTRHSDHHYLASRKFQVLRSEPQSPQLPTGYPGMMVLSLIPPIWFRVVDPIVERMVAANSTLTYASRKAEAINA